jgi:tetratricopeptide (TPR) repeat protein
MVNFFGKRMVLMIALLTCNSCTYHSVTTLTIGTSSSPSSVKVAVPDCLESLPNVPVRKDKSSRDVETEADGLEMQGKGQPALDKYSEAYLLHLREKGYAAGRAMRGDPSASLEINTSIESPEFPFKIGRAFAKAGKHEIAIRCFTESLNKKIASPNDASAYLNRGEAYLATGQKQRARLNYQKAADLFQKYKLPQYQKMAADKLRSVTP